MFNTKLQITKKLEMCWCWRRLYLPSWCLFRLHNQSVCTTLLCPAIAKNSTRFLLYLSVQSLSCCWSQLTTLPFAGVTNMTYDNLSLHQWNYALRGALPDWQLNVCSQFYELKCVCWIYLYPNRDQYFCVAFAYNFSRVCLLLTTCIAEIIRLLPHKIDPQW